MILDEQHADALCAIIALGFIGQNEQAEQAGTSGRVLYLFDDQTDSLEHDRLSTLLQEKFGIKLKTRYENAKNPRDGVKIHPFIYALPYGNPSEPRALDYTAVKVNEKNILDLTQLIETGINSLLTPNNRFRGAYIGGFLNFETHELSLIGPSSLYQRKRRFLDSNQPDPATVNRMFTQCLEVTKSAKNYILKNAPNFYIGSQADYNVRVDPQVTDKWIFSTDSMKVDDLNIFASCHGLVTSLYYYSSFDVPYLNQGVCIELSLSDDTCKSASCIPCALFAAAQGTPASAVHLGRGDYWNLPDDHLQNAENAHLKRNWQDFVKACFISASREILEHPMLDSFPPVTIEVAAIVADSAQVENEIPAMFLDALAFEGPFIKKMLNSFSQ